MELIIYNNSIPEERLILLNSLEIVSDMNLGHNVSTFFL